MFKTHDILLATRISGFKISLSNDIAVAVKTRKKIPVKMTTTPVDGKSSAKPVQSEGVVSFYSKPRFDHFLVSDKSKDYILFRERVELFFETNEVPEDKRCKIFLSSISECVYGLIHDRLFPDLPKTKSLSEVLEVLDSHYLAVTNKRAERYKFNQIRQESGEPLEEFVARIRESAARCDFGHWAKETVTSVSIAAKVKQQVLEDRILDCFVMGLSNAHIQQQLLEQDANSLKEAYEKARTLQMAQQERTDQSLVNEAHGQVAHIARKWSGNSAAQQQQMNNGHWRRDLSRPRSQNYGYANEEQWSRGPRCGRCGRSRHPIESCPARDVTCFNCNQKGHFKNHCHYIKVIASVQEDNYPVRLPLIINNISINFLVDSGACSNIISPELYFQFNREYQLKPYSKIIRNFSGTPLNVKGQVQCPVQIGNQSAEVEFLVVDSNGKGEALLGRPGLDVIFPGWRRNFEVDKILTVNECKASDYLVDLRQRYESVFDGNLNESISGFVAEILLAENHRAIVAKPYNIPFGLRDDVELELKRLVDAGVIEPVTSSRYASPIVVVVKSDGKSIRICIDCKRTINKFVVNSNFYPLPHQDMIFATMSGAKFFCVLDLSNAYLQLKLSEQASEYLTITTPFGYFRYKKLPFGVCAAPSIFQCAIDQIIGGVPMVRAYLDDIIIGGTDEEDCKRNLENVLDRLKFHNVKVNIDKCIILQRSVNYLGHILSEGKVNVNPDKVEALKRAPAPRSTKEVKSYLGLLNYFRKFIPSLAEHIKPLYGLLKKNIKFVWDSNCEAAFKKSKELIAQDACVRIFDPKLHTILMCDASPIGVSAILMQRGSDGQEFPIHFASMLLDETQQKYAQLHREGLAIIFGLKKFYQYLYGRKITIVTDAQSVKEMFHPTKATAAVAALRIQRWGVYLTQFDYDLVHRSSTRMGIPDALSRLPIKSNDNFDLDEKDSSINIVRESVPLQFEEIKIKQDDDPTIALVKKYVKEGFPNIRDVEVNKFRKLKNLLSLEEGTLFFRDRVVIPHCCRKQILDFGHSNHIGIILMKKLLRPLVFWPGMDIDIERWIASCKTCQELCPIGKKKVISTWRPSSKPMERIHLDFFYFEGKQFLVVVDTYSKYIEVKLMSRTDAESVIETLDIIFSDLGLPDTIVSDNGPPFNSYKLETYCKNHKITLLHSPPYNPESNGQAEVAVRIIKNSLKKLTNHLPIQKRLAICLANYKNSPRADGKLTPNECLGSYFPKRPIDLINPVKKVQFKEPKLGGRRVKEGPSNYGEFEVGQHVYFLINDRNKKWVACRILRKESRYIYKVVFNTDNLVRLVHVTKLRKREIRSCVFPPEIVHKEFEETPREIPRRSERIRQMIERKKTD